MINGLSKTGRKTKNCFEAKREPVAIKWVSREPRNIPKASEKSRFCTRVDKAMNGRFSMLPPRKKSVWEALDMLD